MKEKLAFTHFSTLDKWYIEQYLRREISGKYSMVPLSKILQPKRERISSQEYDSNIPLVSKIRFLDGTIFYRTAKPKNDVFLAQRNDLLVSNINFEKGAFCIVDEDLIACSTDYQPYKIIYNAIMPQYLNLCLRCNVFLENVAESKPKGMKTRAKWEFIRTFSIPVPPLSIQAEIINNYQNQVLQAQFIQSEHDYSSIEKILENKLQLQFNHGSQHAEVLAFINYSQCFTWDVKDRKNSVFTSLKYHELPLSAIAQINPSLSQSIKDETEVSFVPMECVSDLDGYIKQTRICKSSAKGFTKFENGDIIWAKITPCMQNGKSAVVYNLKNGIGYGSTEFYVIRVNKEFVIPEYIYYLLRTYRVREAAVSYFSGSAGQQRVRKSFLEELSIPLPSIEEQKEIVEILDAKKAEIISARLQAESLLTKAKQDFENAIFG